MLTGASEESPMRPRRSLTLVLSAALALTGLALIAPPVTAVPKVCDPERVSQTQTGWWWLHGVSAQAVADRAEQVDRHGRRHAVAALPHRQFGGGDRSQSPRLRPFRRPDPGRLHLDRHRLQHHRRGRPDRCLHQGGHGALRQRGGHRDADLVTRLGCLDRHRVPAGPRRSPQVGKFGPIRSGPFGPRLGLCRRSS